MTDNEHSKKVKLMAGGLARTSSILGAASLPLSWMIFGVFLAIIVLSAIGFSTDKNPNKFKRKCLRTGLFCGIIAIILHTVFGLMMLYTDTKLSNSIKIESPLPDKSLNQVIQQAWTGNVKTSFGDMQTSEVLI